MANEASRPDANPDALFARYRETRDPAALGALFDATAPGLFRLALSLTPDAARAEDALQETFLFALEEADRWDPARPVVPWLMTVLRFKVKEGRRRDARTPDPLRLDQAPDPDDPAALAESAEERERLYDAMRRLPEPYRGVALLRWRYGHEPAEIADIRGEPPGTVWSILHRAVRKLKVEMGALPALLLAFRPERGLDGVRRALLRRAAAKAAASAAAGAGAGVVTVTTMGGLLMAKKAAAAALVLLLLAGGGLLLWKNEEPTPARTGIPPTGPLQTTAVRTAPTIHSVPQAGVAPIVPAAPAKPAAVRGNRRVSWPVVPGECPVPPDGTVIPLRPIPGSNENEKDPPPGRMVGADLVVESLPDEKFWNAIAVGPDGSLARLFVDTDSERGRETSFRKGRQLEVILKEEDGSPVAGAWVELRESGNNRLVPPGKTDAAGRVHFEGLPPYDVNLLLIPGEVPLALGLPLGVADLEVGDGHIEVTLRPAVHLDLRVKVNGKAVLPAGLGASFDGALELERKDDQEALLVHYLLRPAARNPVLAVRAGATGYRTGRAVAEWREVEGTFMAEVDLQRAGGRLVIHAIAPPEMRFAWEVRRIDGPKGGQFVASSAFVMADRRPAFGPPENLSIPDLLPGLYQFVTDSGLATEVVELKEGDEAREVSLDLSKTAWVTGRIEAPSGADLRRAHVVIEGEGLLEPARGGFSPGSPGPGRPVGADGSFRIRVPGDRPVQVRAWHPSLVPAPSGGAVDVTGALEGVVLRLVDGAHAVLRLEPDRQSGLRIETRRVLLFRGEPTGTPTSEHLLEHGDGGLRFGGYAQGTYTMVLDVGGSWMPEDPGFAVKILKDVALGASRTDLGTIRLDGGGSVRLDLRLPEGGSPPQLFVSAEALGSPAHRRGLNFFGKGDCVLKGLGKGPYRISVSSGSPPTVLLNKQIESDGAGEVQLTLDLR